MKINDCNMFWIFGTIMLVVICTTLVAIVRDTGDMFNIIITGVVGAISGMFSADFINKGKTKGPDGTI